MALPVFSSEQIAVTPPTPSVELGFTATGRVTATVKVYDADEQVAFNRAARVLDAALDRYGHRAPVPVAK